MVTCKYTDRLFATRFDINVSIEVVDIIARWGRLKVPILRLKRLPLRGVGLTFRLRMAHGYICRWHLSLHARCPESRNMFLVYR